MPIDSEAGKELAILSNLRNHREKLIERMDFDFSKFRGDMFSIPLSEGKWENVTSNRAKSEGRKMIHILAKAERSIFNEAKKEDAEDREKLNFNELLVASLLFSAERLRDGQPETPKLQAEMASYRIFRGWGAYRLLVMEDDDGNPYLDLAVWDPRNTYYIPGRNGLLKTYYERSVLKAQFVDEYKGFNGQADDKGMIKAVDIWDCSDSSRITKEAVRASGEYVKEPEKVLVGGQTIDYLPVRIKAGGAIPLISEIDTATTDPTDNLKEVGESYLANNRNLLDDESRAMSYKKTRAGLEAKMPTIIEYDGQGGELPPEFKKDPYIKGGFIFLDVSKKQKVADQLPMARGELIAQYHADVANQLNTGGLNPIAFGEGGKGQTAFETDVRNRNTRESIDPFREDLEEDFVWIGTEIIKQYKAGSFKDNQIFEGYNSKSKWFSQKIKIEDIKEGKIFKCKLISDELRDKAANAGLAIDLVGAGLLPKREALDDFQISKDPDSTLDAIAQETAEQAFDTPLVKGYLAMREDYLKHPDEDKKKLFKHALIKLLLLEINEMQQIEQALNPSVPDGAANPAKVSKKVTARKAQPSAPQEVQ